MATKISKSQELAGAGNYPAYRLNQRERKALQTAEEYNPASPSSWGTTPPATQDAALDALAANGAGAQFGMATVSVVWDFSVNGGAVGTIPLAVTLPSKAIVVEVVRDVLTAPTSTSSTGTIQLTLPTDGALEQTAKTADGTGAGATESGGSAVPKKTTAARVAQVTIATNAVLSGKIRYFIRYMKSE